MRSIRLLSPRALLVEQNLPLPMAGPGEVLIRVRAAGICHSDAHYRGGRTNLTLPLTPGHEIAGEIERCGQGVDLVREGDRVAVHYLVSCRKCRQCLTGGEQFCARGEMIGKDRDGGYADFIAIPARNAVPIPAGVPFAEAAIMMCSTATALHALRQAKLQPQESVGILGFGGLGISTLQLARHYGAGRIVAIDLVHEKLEVAAALGAGIVNAAKGDITEGILALTGGDGLDVILDLAGNPAACSAALRSLAPRGRLVLVALGLHAFEFDAYRDLLARERSIIGSSDHLVEELTELMNLASRKSIDVSQAITRTVPLDAAAINAVLDDLDSGTAHMRTVIDVG